MKYMGSRREAKLSKGWSRARRRALLTTMMILSLGTLFVGSGGRVGAQQETVDPTEQPSFQAPEDEEFVPGRILVKRKAGAPEEKLEALNRDNNARIEDELPEAQVSVVDLPENLPVKAAVERYENSPVVEYAEPDFLVFPDRTPNDPRYPGQWGLNNTGQTGGTSDADIDAPEAWEGITGGRTIVAVIDSGVQTGHRDLKSNIWSNPGETRNGVDDDGNGLVDDTNGWDFYNGNRTVYDDPETDSHGTHVAGTVAATGNNDAGVVGVNWRARIMPLKFLGPNGGSVSDAILALDYAVDKGAKISNNSWSFTSDTPPQALCDAISDAGSKGHLFVTSAGNGGDDNDTATRDYPSSCESSNIISVAATDDQDQLAGFSNYGAQTVDLGAPGVDVLSTLPENGYGRFSGTSMASPHVAGVAALLKSQTPGLSDEEMKDAILGSVDRKSSLRGKTVTGGRLNATEALGITSTNITLNAKPSTTVYRKVTKLSGRLLSDNGSLGDRSVKILKRPQGAKGFSEAATVRTDPDGTFRFKARPAKRTYYRARFVGDESNGLQPSISPAERVNVRARVTINMSQKNLKLSGRRGMSGRVLPTHSSYVRLAIKRNGDVISRRKVNLDRDGRYRFVYRPSRPGDYRFYAIFSSDRDHLGNRSPQKGFRVVR